MLNLLAIGPLRCWMIGYPIAKLLDFAQLLKYKLTKSVDF